MADVCKGAAAADAKGHMEASVMYRMQQQQSVLA